MMQHLGRGADAAKSIGQLAEDMGLHRRSVEQLLEAMVKSGVPIIANHRGACRVTTPAGMPTADSKRYTHERLRSVGWLVLRTACTSCSWTHYLMPLLIETARTVESVAASEVRYRRFPRDWGILCGISGVAA